MCFCKPRQYKERVLMSYLYAVKKNPFLSDAMLCYIIHTAHSIITSHPSTVHLKYSQERASLKNVENMWVACNTSVNRSKLLQNGQDTCSHVSSLNICDWFVTLPVTPCVSVQPASVLRLPKLTVVTCSTVLSRPRSLAQRNITSSSRPSPATIRKSTGDSCWASGPRPCLRPSNICMAAVPFDQSIGSTITAPLIAVSFLICTHYGYQTYPRLEWL